MEVYVRPYPGPGGRVQVSAEGGTQPVWNAQGEILCRDGIRLMSAAVRTEPTLSIEWPPILFEGNYTFGVAGPFPAFEVTPDGKRFVLIKGADSTDKDSSY